MIYNTMQSLYFNIHLTFLCNDDVFCNLGFCSTPKQILDISKTFVNIVLWH